MTTAVREHPIDLSAPMVRAILNGLKTQTRIVAKPPRGASLVNLDTDCPYKPGDRLWVRERALYWTGGAGGTSDCVYADDAKVASLLRDQFELDCQRAQRPELYRHIGNWEWHSPTHMPRWASRLTLEVTGVRGERVQDISEEDAKAEGAERNVLAGDEASWEPDWGYRPQCSHYPDGCECFPHPNARAWFKEQWDRTKGKKHPWASNPRVLVVEFRRVDGSVGRLP